MNNILSLNNISKVFNTKDGELNIIDNVSFNVKNNEFISIVGTSGCGKSTLLNIISGLDDDYDGSITFNNIKFGYMLQDDALIEYYNIIDNICLGLKIKNKYSNENIEYANYLLDKYNLSDYKYKHPSELSGGMRQRISLIRTLVLKPDVLLLDEPFSALDYTTRLFINDDVYKIVKETGISAIMVTHDINEAIRLSDKVIVLSSKPAKIINIYDINNKDIPSKNKLSVDKYHDLILDDLCQKNN